jgi:peptidoglycan/xylan/chitin deacetylase (PgdA/CDA1 family)
VEFAHADVRKPVSAATITEKYAAMETLLALEHKDLQGFRKALAIWLEEQHGVTTEAILNSYFLDWNQAKQLASDPLVDIGTHCITHRPLARLAHEDARVEITESRTRLERELGVPVKFLAYPYGSRSACGIREFLLAEQAGFTASLTARMGNIFMEHADYLQCLPRVCLSVVPHDAPLRFIKAALYGSRNGIMNKFARVITA